MTFSTFKVVKAVAGANSGVSVSLKKTKNASKASLHVTVSAPVAAGFGWEAGAILEVQLGEGEHHGLVRLRKNASVGTATVRAMKGLGHGYFAISLGHVPAFVDRSAAKTWCTFEKVNDGWIEITLPAWADETAPAPKRELNQPPPAAPRSVPRLAGPAGGATARLMGDPPPGRSALSGQGGTK